MIPRGMSPATDAPRLLVGGLRAADVILVVSSGFAAFYLRHEDFPMPDYYLLGIIVGGALAANMMHLAGIYSLASLQQLSGQIGQLIAGWSGIVLGLTVLGYFTKTSEDFSRIWLALWVTIAFIAMVLLRIVVHWQLMRWQRLGRLRIKVAIVGATELALRLTTQLEKNTDQKYELVGIYDDRTTRLPPGFAELRRSGTVADLILRFRKEPIDEIVLALPWMESTRIVRILKELKVLPTNVRLCPETVGFELPVHGFASVGGVPMLSIFDRPLAGWNVLLKAVEDRVLGAIALLIVLPYMALIAIAIKLDSPGPVLFGQRRYGFNNNEFTLYKFRTMFVDATDDATTPQAKRNDPRVTRVGAFLRRTSVDELPQLFNVIRGEMSLVGPRPHAVVHNQQFATLIDDYLSRHRVKPGITGWAQVNGLRGEIDSLDKIKARVQHDLYYIDNWSLFFDLKILFLTVFVGFVNRNAY